MTTSASWRSAKKRGGHRRRDCDVCAPEPGPSAPPRIAPEERFWLDSGDLVHSLPTPPDHRFEPAEPRPALDAN